MTIKDLARLSGYSLGTVSRVLNNQPNVSRKARETIMAIVNEAGFELNNNAKNLKQQKSTSIAVIIKGFANELFAQLAEQIQTGMARLDYPVHLHYIDEDDNEVRYALQLCRERKPLGILFLGGSSENFAADFAGIHVPAVLVTHSAAHLSFPNLSSVSTDDTAAARAAVTHLIERGHRSLAVIGGVVEKSEISRLRLQGCEQAVEEAEDDVRWVYEPTRFSFQSGYDAMARLLDRADAPVTAVFAMADVLAIGAMRCIRDRGLRVPEDISVVGFDGTAIGRYYCPRLTSVYQMADQLAEASVNILADALQGAPACHKTTPYELVRLESVQDCY